MIPRPLANLPCLLLAALVPTGCSDSGGTAEPLCSALPATPPTPATPYVATAESLSQHPIPTWYGDAKFGIMIHWGLYSVPGWAETTLNFEDWNVDAQLSDPDFGAAWYRQNAYAE